jgi:alpha-1,6-mannosyltransferase
LVDDSVGQLANGVDPEGLAEAIEALFARDLEALSQAARRRAETRHGWDITFEKLMQIYAEVLEGAARPLALSA